MYHYGLNLGPSMVWSNWSDLSKYSEVHDQRRRHHQQNWFIRWVPTSYMIRDIFVIIFKMYQVQTQALMWSKQNKYICPCIKKSMIRDVVIIIISKIGSVFFALTRHLAHWILSGLRVLGRVKKWLLCLSLRPHTNGLKYFPIELSYFQASMWNIRYFHGFLF